MGTVRHWKHIGRN